MADHFPVPDRYTNGVHQCTTNVKYIGREPIAYTYMFGNALLGLYWRVNFFTRTQYSFSEMSRPHNDIIAPPEGNDQGMTGGKDKAVCLPSKQ